jgi:hypothetical protein
MNPINLFMTAPSQKLSIAPVKPRYTLERGGAKPVTPGSDFEEALELENLCPVGLVGLEPVWDAYDMWI